MNEAELRQLPEAQVMAKAVELAREIGGEAAARRVRLMPPEQVLNFLVVNGR